MVMSVPGPSISSIKMLSTVPIYSMETIAQQVARQDEQMRHLRATNKALVAQLTALNGKVTAIKGQLASLKTAQQQQPVQPPPIRVPKIRAPAPRPNESAAGAETHSVHPLRSA